MFQFWFCYHLMQLIWVCIAFCASSKCLKNSGNMFGQVWTWLQLRVLFRNQLERSRCKLDHTFHRCLCQVVTSNRTAANPWWEITFKIFWDLLRPFNILEALLWRKSHLLPVPTSSLVVRSSPEGKHPKLPENFNIFNDSGALVLPSPKGSVERALHKGNMSKLKFSNSPSSTFHWNSTSTNPNSTGWTCCSTKHVIFIDIQCLFAVDTLENDRSQALPGPLSKCIYTCSTNPFCVPKHFDRSELQL